MKRMRIMGLSLVAVFAMSAVAVNSVSAAAKPKPVLKLVTAKGDLAVGAELKASSSDLVFVTSAGNLECSSNVLTGAITVNNNASKDKANITAESSTGEFEGGACKTTTPLGPALITASGLSWPAEFTNKGTSTLKGTKKVVFTSVFPLAGGAKCVYESAKVASTFTVGGATELTTSNQLFKYNKKLSNAACPTEGKLSGHFAVTSGGETVETLFAP